jgi:hypothetical protein
VDFVEPLRFDVVPTAVRRYRGLRFRRAVLIRDDDSACKGQELFAQQFVGNGLVGINYEGSLFRLT